MGRRKAGGAFEQEFQKSFQIALEWIEGELELETGIVDWHRIADTTSIKWMRGQCYTCGRIAPAHCVHCGGEMGHPNILPRSDADYRAFFRDRLRLFECKSSKSPTSFPSGVGEKGNIREGQWEIALLVENLPYVDYWWAINDRRRPRHYRMWMVPGVVGIERLRDISNNLKGRGGNTIKWQAFDSEEAIDEKVSFPCPRMYGQFFDLTSIFSIFLEKEIPPITNEFIRSYLDKKIGIDERLIL